jgi:hypothetical protein
LIGFIDPPGRFRPRKEWEDFLNQMKALPEDDPQVQGAMREAEEVAEPPAQPGGLAEEPHERAAKEISGICSKHT